MTASDLLAEARAHGLLVTRDGPELVIRGPEAEAAIAERLLAAKAALLAALVDEELARAIDTTIARLADWHVAGWMDSNVGFADRWEAVNLAALQHDPSAVARALRALEGFAYAYYRLEAPSTPASASETSETTSSGGQAP